MQIEKRLHLVLEKRVSKVQIDIVLDNCILYIYLDRLMRVIVVSFD